MPRISGGLPRCPRTSAELSLEGRVMPNRTAKWGTGTLGEEPLRSGLLVQGTSTFRTAVYGPVRTVVWEGSSRDHRLPPIPIDPENDLTLFSSPLKY